MKKVDTLFKVGDQIKVNSTQEVGLIEEIISILDNGASTYLVNINNKDRMYSEYDLSLYREKLNLPGVSMDDLEILIEVEDKMDDIIHELGLAKCDNEEDELANACKLQHYLVCLEKNQNEIVPAAKNERLRVLYDGLVNGNFDFVSYANVFTEILKRVGMQVYNVGVKDENNEFYMCNLVHIGSKFYYFDVNLERDIYLDNDFEEFSLCCAGIGSDKYSAYFKPLNILEFDGNSKKAELPKNISKEDIDIELINKF